MKALPRSRSLEHVKRLLEQLVSVPPLERKAWLDRNCDGRASLRAELESLLRFHPASDPHSQAAAEEAPGEDATPLLTPGDLVAGRYRVGELRGRGSHGDVYLVHDTTAASRLGLKVLHSERTSSTAQLRHEMQVLRRVRHPAVVRVFEAFEHRGRPCLTMEWVDGADLATLLAQSGRMAPWRVREIALELAEGLALAHELGIVHRDLKPSNVLIDRNGRVKITDFALAGALGEEGADLSVGTPLYMAPEQLGAGSGISARCDVYALATLLYEAVTGRLPFPGWDLLQSLERKSEGRPRPPSRYCPDIPPQLEEAILAGLARDPDERPRSGEDFAELVRRGPSREAAFPQRGERRLLTVMSVGVVPVGGEPATGSAVPLIERTSRVVSGNGGHVAFASHDSVLAYFGFPMAREDDADRAIRAARELLGRGPERSASSGLACRVGIASGEVQLDRVDEGPELMAFGAAPGRAEQLRRAAKAGEALVSSESLRLARDPVGEKDARWLRPEAAGSRASSSEAREPRKRYARVRESPFVGRRQELGGLLALWSRARRGEGQAVTVMGEPGIGKTRLVRALRERLSGERPRWLEIRGVEQYQSTAFWAVARLIEEQLDLGSCSSNLERRSRLASALGAAGMDPDRDLPLVAQPLGLLEGPDEPPAGPGTTREASIRALATYLLRRRPTVLHCEDLQWLDPSSLELIGASIAQRGSSPVLIVGTAREEFVSPWPVDQLINLNRLPPEKAGFLVDFLAADADLGASERALILERARGVPIFLEALVEQRLEGPSLERRHERLPITLRGLLEARLDRLGRTKRVAQLGACIGRRFSQALIEAVAGARAGRAKAGVAADLERLVEARVLRRASEPSGVVYDFGHALLADTARETLPEDQRREAHAAIAWSRAQLEPELTARHPELLAYHIERAGVADAALEAWERAAAAAEGRGEHIEARQHLERALAQLRQAVAPERQAEVELRLRAALIQSIYAVNYGSADFERNLERMQELIGSSDDPRAARVLILMSRLCLLRGDIPRCRELAEQQLRWLPGATPEIALAIHSQLGNFRMTLGEVAAARPHFDEVARLAPGEGDPPPSDPFTQWIVAARVPTRSILLWLAGELRASRNELQGWLPRTDELSLVQAVTMRIYAALPLLLLGELAEARRQATEALEVAEARGFAFVAPFGRGLVGGAMAGAGELEAGVVELQAAVAQMHELGQVAQPTCCEAFLAEALVELGRLEEADAALASVLQDLGGRASWEPELHRIRARILHRMGQPAEAERHLGRSLHVARLRGMGSFELRSATELARVLLERNGPEEARYALAPVCARFDAEIETPDVRAARQLLRRLL